VPECLDEFGNQRFIEGVDALRRRHGNLSYRRCSAIDPTFFMGTLFPCRIDSIAVFAAEMFVQLIHHWIQK
jgi:hypothetical protein